MFWRFFIRINLHPSSFTIKYFCTFKPNISVQNYYHQSIFPQRINIPVWPVFTLNILILFLFGHCFLILCLVVIIGLLLLIVTVSKVNYFTQQKKLCNAFYIADLIFCGETRWNSQRGSWSWARLTLMIVMIMMMVWLSR